MSETQTIPQPSVAASVTRLYNYSTWLHVGSGAEECADAETGNCGDPSHFHAWCRLANPVQHRDIRARALAAKARRVRQLRDPDTDASAVLEEDLDRIARVGEDARDELVDELIGVDWATHYLAAVEAVKGEIVDDEETWEHIDLDQARYQEITELAEDDRPADEYAELEKRLAAYNEAVDAEYRRRMDPQEKAFREKDISALLDLIRDRRIDLDAIEEFMHTYAIHQWVAGTFTKPKGKALWSEPADLRDIAPEIVEGLADTYRDLEATQREVTSQGNT